MSDDVTDESAHIIRAIVAHEKSRNPFFHHGPCIGGPNGNGGTWAYEGDSIDITDPWPDVNDPDFTYQWLKNTSAYTWDQSRSAWVWNPVSLLERAKMAHDSTLGVTWDDVEQALLGKYRRMRTWEKKLAQRASEKLIVRMVMSHRPPTDQ